MIKARKRTREENVYANSYGDLLAAIKSSHLVYENTEGSYQGEYIVVLYSNKRYTFYVDDYGSCSGCDYLMGHDVDDEKKPIHYDYAIPYTEALDYCSQSIPKYIIPAQCFKTFDQLQQFSESLLRKEPLIELEGLTPPPPKEPIVYTPEQEKIKERFEKIFMETQK